MHPLVLGFKESLVQCIDGIFANRTGWIQVDLSENAHEALALWLCMTVRTNKEGRSHILLRVLLCVLHIFVICQESAANYLRQGFSCLKSVHQSFWPKDRSQTCSIKSRGRKPKFPKTVALVIAEDLPRQRLLDCVANLAHWYSPTQFIRAIKQLICVTAL